MDASTLLKEAQQAATVAQQIAAKAKADGGRALTPAERTEYQKQYDLAVAKKAESDQAKKDADSQALFNVLSGSKSEPAPGDDGEFSTEGPSTLGAQFKQRTWHSPRELAAKMASTIGAKGIVQGTFHSEAVTIPVSALPHPPRRFLELLPEPQEVRSNLFQYLRQVARDNKAAVVPDGQLKPTSTFTWEEVEDRAHVIAHLSEPFPQRYLTDHAALTPLLEAEFRNGLLQTLEAELLDGAGGTDHIKGVLQTDGLVEVDFTESKLRTLRRARTRMEALGENPTGWVFHPDDLEELDLTRENGETGDFLTLDRVLGNLPRVPAPGVTKGTALLGDWRQVQPLVRESASVTVHMGDAELFRKNLVQIRAEQRNALLFHRPQAVAVVQLAGPTQG